MITPEGIVIEYNLKFQFKSTNNEAEYKVMNTGLHLCKALEAKCVSLKTNSQLLMNQILGEYEAREAIMQKYLLKSKELISNLSQFKLKDFSYPRTCMLMPYQNWEVPAYMILKGQS